ncbi:MAG: flagellar hook protein FlgE [Gammaproteobacteria bacterium]|nr:flagellar hook protein FlgE [Gammaproteobacteria bacterium]
MPFRIALSGLNAATSDLNVIGNNIANNATTGFKGSRAEFGDIYAASSLGASSNAIGSGVRLQKVGQQFSQGTVNFTNNNLDLAINGSGFFRLNDNGTTVYSRAGAFGVDKDGFVVNSTGQRLTAFQATSTGAITGARGDLKLSTANIPPKVSGTITVGVNLNAAAAVPTVAFSTAGPAAPDPASYNNSTSLTVYDSLGAPHLATLYFVKESAANSWTVYSQLDNIFPAQGTANNLVFSPTGALTTPGTPGNIVLTPITIPPPSGANPLTLTFNYTNTTQLGNAFGVNSLTQNGYANGRLSGLSIDNSGVVSARYTNGQSSSLGQVILTNFANPQGLQQLGNTSWAETFTSGAALDGAPGTGSLGAIQSGALEGSNVDLTEQLVNMITAQRNFQANAQVISAADTVTQAIINIR